MDFGSGYDLALLTNFLHHFDIPTCEALLRKVSKAALKLGEAAPQLSSSFQTKTACRLPRPPLLA